MFEPTPPRLLVSALAVALAPALLEAAPKPPTPAAACVTPEIRDHPDGRARMTLDVLTFNIEGLGFPARLSRARQLGEIGKRLSALRAAGQAPDIILFQEVFSDAAKQAVAATGYPDQIHGPGRSSRRELPAATAERADAGRRSVKRGEIGLKFSSGGLAIASRYPIVTHKAEPFAKKSCAGLDCLANKGALFARVSIPGAPDPIDIFDTHMNSRTASKAPPRRSLPIHHAESVELGDFIDAVNAPANPTLLGGDFNIRNSEARFDFLEARLPLTLVHRYCLEPNAGCDIRMSFDGDAPWLDTQDLQFFRPGTRTQLKPIRVETMFDGAANSPRLSDHDGYRVIYELSWPSEATTEIAEACAKPG